MIELQLAPEERQLRQFGRYWLPLFGLALGAILTWRFDLPLAGRAVWGGIGLLWLAGFAHRGAWRLAWVLSMLIAFPIGWVISNLILVLLFYGVMSPLGLLARVFRADPLHRQLDRETESYWVQRPAQRPAEDYFRQY